MRFLQTCGAMVPSTEQHLEKYQYFGDTSAIYQDYSVSIGIAGTNVLIPTWCRCLNQNQATRFVGCHQNLARSNVDNWFLSEGQLRSDRWLDSSIRVKIDQIWPAWFQSKVNRLDKNYLIALSSLSTSKTTLNDVETTLKRRRNDARLWNKWSRHMLRKFCFGFQSRKNKSSSWLRSQNI